jgi:hypothetical protein
MIFIRYVLALGLFLAGLFCIALMIVDGFNWSLTATAVMTIFFAGCFKPSSSRQDNSYSFADEAGSSFIGEVIVQGLFNLITWPIRILFQALFD